MTGDFEMPRLLIIADDLSGATDAAGASGSEAVVILGGGHAADVDVVAVDIDSRQLDAESARDRAASVASEASGMVFHKIDSLLRGNWPFELQGMLQALGKSARAPLALIAPAWPERNRTTVEGTVWLDSVPLSATGLRDDAGNPLHDDIAGRLAEAGLTSLPLPGHGLSDLPDVDAVICDATSRDALDRIAAIAAASNRPVLCVGSGGLVQSIARTLRLPPIASAAVAAAGSVLVVVGSATEISRRQVGKLRESGAAVLVLAPGAAPDLHLIGKLLRAERDVVITFEMAGHGGLEPGIVAELAATLAPLMPRIGGLILTGGETARAVLTAAGVRGIRVRGEIEPGVPIGVILGAIALPIVTKAGTFGDDHTLARALATLRPSARPA